MNEITTFNPTGLDVQSPETMPHSIEAEQSVLGGLLLSPGKSVYSGFSLLTEGQKTRD